MKNIIIIAIMVISTGQLIAQTSKKIVPPQPPQPPVEMQKTVPPAPPTPPAPPSPPIPVIKAVPPKPQKTAIPKEEKVIFVAPVIVKD